MAWRLARSLETLRNEVNAAWPKRSKVSDGTLGDPAHAARKSDHNPNPAGVVRALDITAQGIDANAYAEWLRALGRTGHIPLQGGGYIIWNRHSASASTGWNWRPYTGSNDHTKHVHCSVGKLPANYDATVRWGITATPTTRPEVSFMAALSEAEQHELLAEVRAAKVLAQSANERCARLEKSIHGTDDETRHNSIWWQVEYLYREILDGDNAEKLRRLLASV